MDNIFQCLVDHFGDQIKTAEALKTRQSTVSGWVTGRHGMCAETALLAEIKTNGLFKASDLRPKLKGLEAA